MPPGSGSSSLHKTFVSFGRSTALIGSQQQARFASSKSSSPVPNEDTGLQKKIEAHKEHETPNPKKTQAQIDEELRAAMEGREGDGGLAGAELEGGKAVGLKRGVRDNMFRYI